MKLAPWYQRHQCPSSMCRSSWSSVVLFHGAHVLVPIVQVSAYLAQDDDESDPRAEVGVMLSCH